MQRNFERDDPRRRYRANDDPRDDPRERYGNEEDRWSREYRRAYAEEDLPRRLHDDRPYDRPDYEPEAGRSGGRENVDLDRGRRESQYRRSDDRYAGDPYDVDREQPTGQRGGFSGYGRRDDRWQGGYYGQGQRFEGEPFNRGRSGSRSPGQDYGQSGRTQRYGQPSYGRAASPYDEGDVGSWYGGDTGMGDPGSSQYGSPSGPEFWRQQGSQYGDQFGSQAHSRSGQSGRAGSGWMRGQFSGRGPRGYQRSDERIHEDVCELLTHHGEIDASGMEVQVRDATVILRGMAESGRTRRLAEELIEEIPGVRDILNELRVRQRTGSASAGSHHMVDSGTFADDRDGLRDSGIPAYGTGVAGSSGVSTRSGPGEPGASAGAGSSQQGNRWQIRETMDVVGSDGERVGSVKAVHGTDFHVDRPMRRNLFVPFSAVRTVDGERVMLNVRASEVDDQHWPAPGLTGANEGSADR